MAFFMVHIIFVVVNDSYTHDLSQLLKIANLHQILIADAKNDVSLEINWSVVKDWSEQFRYDNNISKAMAEQLFDANLTIDAAMWFYYPDLSWRYILVISDFSERGPAEIYRKISEINRNSISKKYKPIPLEAIEAKGDSAFIYKMLKGFARVNDGKVRVSNSMVNGLEIVDCLIYELK
eukprot:gene15823-18804_t